MHNGRRRGLLTYSNTIATLALCIALGGTSYAAVNISGEQIRDGSVTSRDLRNGGVRESDLGRGSVSGKKVRDFSLLARDFKAGELPTGTAGERGIPGAQGADGAQLPVLARRRGSRKLDQRRQGGRDGAFEPRSHRAAHQRCRKT
jgi:hypothetical protein